MGKFIDLTGQKFGRLTVIQRYSNTKCKRVSWICQCDCGNQVIVTTDNLRRKNSTSCGCKRKETRFQQRKRNEYSFDYENNIGYCYGLHGQYFIFDIEDYDKIKNYTWSQDSTGHWHFKTSNKQIQLTHLLLPEVPKSQIIDHKDKNPNNNCKTNLRIASKQENSRNSNIPSNNSSGFIGVNYIKSSGKWKAYIFIHNKQKHLGNFNNIQDAIKARLQAEKNYYGEFAPQNYLFKEYDIT